MNTPPKGSTAPAPRTTSPFLNLAPELRNRIYTEVFQGDVFEPGIHTAPGILAACKQTYDEAIGLFYATATFHVNDRAVLLSWLTDLPSKHRTSLTAIRCDHGLYKYPTPSPPPTPRSPYMSYNCGAAHFFLGQREYEILQQVSKLLETGGIGIRKDVLKAHVVPFGPYGDPEDAVWTSEPGEAASRIQERKKKYPEGTNWAVDRETGKWTPMLPC